MSLNVYQPKASLMASLRYIIIKKSWIRWCWHLQCDDVCMCSVCTPPTKMVLQSSFVMTMAGLVMGSRLRVTACRADHGSQWDNGHNSRSTSLTSVPAPSQVRCLTLSSLLAVHWCVFSVGVTPSLCPLIILALALNTRHSPVVTCYLSSLRLSPMKSFSSIHILCHVNINKPAIKKQSLPTIKLTDSCGWKTAIWQSIIVHTWTSL